MALAKAVAKELVRLAGSGEEPDPLTNLRLQKLLYFAQVWSLVTRDSALFPEEIEAWKKGPVVRDVYNVVRCQLPDGRTADPVSEQMLGAGAELAADEKVFVRGVWEAYKKYSATALAEISHDRPWKIAYGDTPNGGHCERPIMEADMEDFYARQDMPGPIAQYLHARHDEERRACERLEQIPQFDPSQLARFAVTRAR